MSVFDELLAIKRFREGQAELAVARQRKVHAEAEHQREVASEQLTEYRTWAQQQEEGFYRDLCSRIVRVREIEGVLQGVAELRQGERDHQTRVESASQEVIDQANALAERRLSHREARRVTDKFVELAHVYLVEHLRELERKEDSEMEEASLVMRDRDDWTQNEEYELS